MWKDNEFSFYLYRGIQKPQCVTGDTQTQSKRHCSALEFEGSTKGRPSNLEQQRHRSSSGRKALLEKRGMDRVCRILNKEDISVMLVVPVFKIVSFNKKNPYTYKQQFEALSLHLLWLSYFRSTNVALLNGSVFSETIISLSSPTDALIPIIYRNIVPENLRRCLKCA